MLAGHVDNFCCFLAPGVVALAWPNDENDFNDPQWEISNDAYERLSNTTGEVRAGACRPSQHSCACVGSRRLTVLLRTLSGVCKRVQPTLCAPCTFDENPPMAPAYTRVDAKGRKLTIVKVPCPPAIFRTYREAGGLLVRACRCCHRHGAPQLLLLMLLLLSCWSPFPLSVASLGHTPHSSPPLAARPL